jgi:hypothetical protein
MEMNINLHIERLIIDGVPLEAGGASRLKAAVESELARLLAEGGLAPELWGGGALPSVGAGHIQAAGERDAVGLGRQIAHATYGGIGR